MKFLLFFLLVSSLMTCVTKEKVNDLRKLEYKGNVHTVKEISYLFYETNGQIELDHDFLDYNSYEFNQAGNLLNERSHYSDEVIASLKTYTYDDRGNLSGDVVYLRGDFQWKFAYRYDKNNNKISRYYIKEKDQVVQIDSFVYNLKGDIIKEITSQGKSIIGRDLTKYDHNGNKIEYESYNSNNEISSKCSYSYSNNGRQVDSKCYYFSNILTGKTIPEFYVSEMVITNDKGLIIKSKEYNGKFDETTITERNYDKNKNVTTTITKYSYDEDKNIRIKYDATTFTEYSYDENKNVIKKQEYDVENQSSIEIYSYTYDKFNNWVTEIYSSDGEAISKTERTITYYGE